VFFLPLKVTNRNDEELRVVLMSNWPNIVLSTSAHTPYRGVSFFLLGQRSVSDQCHCASCVCPSIYIYGESEEVKQRISNQKRLYITNWDSGGVVANR